MESKKIIEVFVETDEEESSSSSSDDDRVKMVTKVSKTKDSSIKEGQARCVDIGGNNAPVQTAPQLHGREETRESERMDVESTKASNFNTGLAKQGAKKENAVSRHLRESDGSSSSSDSPSSDESMDSNENVQPENSAIEADQDGIPKPTTLSNTPSDDKIYCICRQPALNQFMIQCDKCQDWFHGSCVGITLQRAANIKEFYCPLCTVKDPSLSTIFKPSENEEPKPKHVKKMTQSTLAAKKCAKKHSRRCGECVACLTVTDCTKCRFCKDMRKYGGPGRMRQKCIKRQCLRFSRILYAEDPLNKKKGTHQVAFQQDVIAELKALGGDVDLSEDAAATGPDAKRIRNEGTGEEGRPDGPKQKHGSRVKTGKRASKKSVQSKSIRSAKKAAVTSSGSEAEMGGTGHQGSSATSPYDERYPVQRCEGPGCVFLAQPGSRYCSEDCGVNLAKIRITSHLPKQKELWEQGDQEAMATKMNKQKLQELEDTQKSIKKRLEELDQQTLAIDAHVLLAGKATPVADEESLDTNKSDELMIYCATCGQPQPLRAALTHFEKCYSKAEGMVSFGSVVRNEGTSIFCDKYDPVQQSYCKRLRVLCPEHTKEPKISPNEVCGCPLDPNFPCIVPNPLEMKFCRQPKRSCTRHYCWERLRRAEIDQEKLNLYLKLEDVSEQIRINQWQIENRGSLLPMMLHHTVDHTKGTPQSSPWRQ